MPESRRPMLVQTRQSRDQIVQDLDPATILAVIPTLNEEDYIETCVRSLMAGDTRLTQISCVVADGGSIDTTRAIVAKLQNEFPNLTLLDNPKKLQSAAINLAVEQHSSEDTRYVVRCDAHSVYPHRFIFDVVASLIATGAASVVVPMDAYGESCFEKANAWIVDTPLGSGGSAHRGGNTSTFVDHGHHAGFAVSMFNKIGGYDESFSHNEDAEYDERLGQAGGRIFLNADIRVRYRPRSSLRALARQYFNYGKGRARTVMKHKKRLKLRQTIPILALLGSIFGLLVGPTFWPAALLPLSYIGLLGAASLICAFMNRSFCGLYAGLASGCMHMSWATGFLYQSLRSRT